MLSGEADGIPVTRGRTTEADAVRRGDGDRGRIEPERDDDESGRNRRKQPGHVERQATTLARTLPGAEGSQRKSPEHDQRASQDSKLRAIPELAEMAEADCDGDEQKEAEQNRSDSGHRGHEAIAFLADDVGDEETGASSE